MQKEIGDMQKIILKCNGEFLQQKKPDDFVVATGQAFSVRQFVEIASKYLGLKIYWQGKGLNEVGYLKKGSKKEVIIKIDQNYFRPNEVQYLEVMQEKAF